MVPSEEIFIFSPSNIQGFRLAYLSHRHPFASYPACRTTPSFFLAYFLSNLPFPDLCPSLFILHRFAAADYPDQNDDDRDNQKDVDETGLDCGGSCFQHKGYLPFTFSSSAPVGAFISSGMAFLSFFVSLAFISSFWEEVVLPPFCGLLAIVVLNLPKFNFMPLIDLHEPGHPIPLFYQENRIGFLNMEGWQSGLMRLS